VRAWSLHSYVVWNEVGIPCHTTAPPQPRPLLPPSCPPPMTAWKGIIDPVCSSLTPPWHWQHATVNLHDSQGDLLPEEQPLPPLLFPGVLNPLRPPMHILITTASVGHLQASRPSNGNGIRQGLFSAAMGRLPNASR